MVFGYKGASFGWLKAKITHYTGQIFYIVIAVFCPVSVGIEDKKWKRPRVKYCWRRFSQVMKQGLKQFRTGKRYFSGGHSFFVV